ncbi:GNAT family N-acetyltransferase [Schlesneria paludicola]|uniref:GNAT family N-acetyltransferase n=1 Tax=Schlesneria paludicola TaxID=360056 RepID=UPI00029A86ED|nr:GNAT family N-acetyltransferase [Schlesneria paludicola]
MHADVVIRPALYEDLFAIVTLINDGGPDGKPRENLPSNLPDCYRESFTRILQDENTFLMVAELHGRVVGTFQLNYLICLAGKGQEDAQLEGVHVQSQSRGQGMGMQMIAWVIKHAKTRNCRRIQLTTDKKRKRAHQFYERLGFVASHEGMKLLLDICQN